MTASSAGSPPWWKANIAITKPGGLTSSEALAKGLPMIISNPIPGQEERNARYLLKHGVAEQADEPEATALLAQAGGCVSTVVAIVIPCVAFLRFHASATKTLKPVSKSPTVLSF